MHRHIDLIRRTVERLRMMQTLRSYPQMMKFSAGQRVRFEPPGGSVIEGFVSRYNRKTVILVTNGGEHWSAAPALLRPAAVATDAVELIEAPLHKDPT
jgi:hypothetical protein